MTLARRTRRASDPLTGLALALCVGSYVLQQSLIVPVLPTIQRQMDVDASTASWVFTAYLVSASVLTPLIGRLGDDLGLQRTLLACMILMAIGCLMAAFASSIGWLIAARAVQGAGGAAVPLSFALVRDSYPLDRVGSTIAWLASLTSVAFGIGIIAAGAVVSYAGYAAIYWLPVVLCGASALAVALFVPHSDETTRPILPIGAAIWLSVGLSGLLLVISEGQGWGWTSTQTAIAAAGCAVGFALWIRIEVRAETPLIDLSLLRRRGVWSTGLIAFSLGFGNLAAWAFMSQFVQVSSDTGYGLGIPEVRAGFLLLPMAITSFIAGSGSAHVQRAIGFRGSVAIGCATGAVAYGMLALVHSEPWQVAAWMGLAGLGSGLVFSTMTTVLILSVPPDQTGLASGLNYNLRSMSGALGATVLGALLGSQAAGSYPDELNFESGFWVLSTALLLGALAAGLLPTSRPGPSPATSNSKDRETIWTARSRSSRS